MFEYSVRIVKIVEKIPKAHFLIVGDGVYRKYLESLTRKLGLNQNVIFTGIRSDIPQILAALDVYVLSSVSEGFGRSIIEAMACAKPIVATRVGGIPEAIEHGANGLLVPAKNPAALSQAIISILENKHKSRQMGLLGRQRAQELFTAKDHDQRTEGLYTQIISQ